MTVNQYDDIKVCNIGLSLIGIEQIESFEEETDAAATCAQLYPITRDSVLSKFNWNVATIERQLARIADATPLRKWRYVYRLPSSLLSGPFAVYMDGSNRPSNNYQVSGDTLNCDAESVVINFRNSKDPSSWPAYLVELIGVATGARVCKTLTDNSERAAELQEEAFGTSQENGQGGLFKTAKTLDAQSRPASNIFAAGDILSSTRY